MITRRGSQANLGLGLHNVVSSVVDTGRRTPLGQRPSGTPRPGGGSSINFSSAINSISESLFFLPLPINVTF